jgi:hypothetical protein
MHKEPKYGYTKSGRPIHALTVDYHKTGTFFQKINTKLGLKVTLIVGTMWCAYLFTILALLALPSAIHQGIYYIIVWLSSSFLQLVLLPIIIVGQNIQTTASDIRSAKTFEDTELIIERLRIDTEGGLGDLKKYVDVQFEEIINILKSKEKEIESK